MSNIEIGEAALHNAAPGPSSPKLILLDIILAILVSKKKIAKFTVAAALLAVGVSLMMPNVYVAKTVLAPPQPGSSLATAMLGDVRSLLGTTDLGLKDPNEPYLGALQSRTVADNMIRRFDLKRVYDQTTLHDTRLELESHRRFESTAGSTITITVDDKDPIRAAEMANGFADELRNITARVAMDEAREKRRFYEEQLAAANRAYDESAKALSAVQQKTGILAVEPQVALTIGSIANASAMVAAKQIEIQAMRSYATPDNPDLIRMENELKGLRAHQIELERTSVGGDGKTQISAKNITGPAMEVANKMRDVKFNGVMVELLGKQVEIAKLDEGVTPPSIVAFDKATTPEKKSYPRRGLILIVTVFLAAFFSSMYYAFKSMYQSGMVDEEVTVRIAEIGEQLRFSRFRFPLRRR